MQVTDIKGILHEVKNVHEELQSMMDIDTLITQIKQLDQQTYDAAFWDDTAHAQKVTKELNLKKKKLELYQTYQTTVENLFVLAEFIEVEEESITEFEEEYDLFLQLSETIRLNLLLRDENDQLNAVIEIHPGAGGTESQDWADMLFRMYTRHGEQKEYEFELLDHQNGDEAGIKSVTFCLRGENAYGYLKAEHGVHRLVRISPFDSGGRRHTSFASVTVYPEVDGDVQVDMNEKDLKIDTYRSSGAGGQSVNTTDSAVRITHIPTKTVVTVQNERSQIKNREKALNILKGKLYQLELEKKKEELNQLKQATVSNSFGSQIRSYVMHPYSMVKDHRTNAETGNVSKVLDGDIDLFVNEYLKEQAKE